MKEPIIEADENWFSITFERDVQKYSQTDTPVNKPVNLNQFHGQIFNCLKENPYITYDELSEKLKTLNILERIGSDKKGHWLVKLPS